MFRSIFQKIPTVHRKIDGGRTLPHPVWSPVAQQAHNKPPTYPDPRTFKYKPQPKVWKLTKMRGDRKSRGARNNTKKAKKEMPKGERLLYLSAAIASLASVSWLVRDYLRQRKEGVIRESDKFHQLEHEERVEGSLKKIEENVVSMDKKLDNLKTMYVKVGSEEKNEKNGGKKKKKDV